MTREQVRQIIGEGATEEQINAILNANSADIGRARGDTETLRQQNADLTARLDTASQTLTALQNSQQDVDQIRAELENFRTAEQQRQADEQQRQANARIADRFNTAAKDARFVNDFTRAAIAEQFRAAVNAPENVGRSDADIYAGLVNGKDNLFANPNPGIDIPGPSNINNRMLTAEAFKAMPLAEQMQWANANPDLYAKISQII